MEIQVLAPRKLILKRLTIVLLVVLAASIVLYQLRAQLLMRAVNMALADAQATIVQLNGLSFAWRGVSADKLVIGSGVRYCPASP